MQALHLKVRGERSSLQTAMVLFCVFLVTLVGLVSPQEHQMYQGAGGHQGHQGQAAGEEGVEAVVEAMLAGDMVDSHLMAADTEHFLEHLNTDIEQFRQLKDRVHHLQVHWCMVHGAWYMVYIKMVRKSNF